MEAGLPWTTLDYLWTTNARPFSVCATFYRPPEKIASLASIFLEDQTHSVYLPLIQQRIIHYFSYRVYSPSIFLFKGGCLWTPSGQHLPVHLASVQHFPVHRASGQQMPVHRASGQHFIGPRRH